MLQANSNTLKKVKKLKNLGVVFTNHGSKNKEIDAWIGKANAILHELYPSSVTKWDLSNMNLSIFD